MSLEDRGEAAKALASIGIEVYDQNGAYQDFSVTLDELSAKWDSLTDAQRANVSEALAGVRNINTMQQIIATWDEAKELAGMVEEDPNYYLEVQEKGMNSIQSNMDTLKATMQDFWYNFLNQDAINSGLQGLTGIANVIAEITKAAQSLPAVGDTLSTLLLGVGTVGTSGLIDNILKARQQMKKEGLNTGLFGGFGRGLKQTGQDLSVLGMTEDGVLNHISLFGALKDGFASAQAEGKGFFKSTAAGVKTLYGSLGTMGKAVMGLTGAFLAIEVASKVFDAVTTSAEESKTKIRDLNAEYENQRQTMEDNRDTIDSIGSEWERLSKGVDTSTNENISLTNDEYQRYLELNKQIASMFPSVVSSYDAQGNAILSLKGSLEALNSEYEKTVKQQSMDRYNESINDYLREFENRTGDMSFGDRLATAWSGADWSDYQGNESIINTLNKLKQAESFENDVLPYLREKDWTANLAKQINELLGTSDQITEEEWNEILNSGALENAIDIQEEIIEEAKGDLTSILQDYVRSLTAEGGDYDDLEDNVVTSINKLIAGSSVEELKELEGNRAKASLFVRDYLDRFSGNEEAQNSLVNLGKLNDGSSLQDILAAYKNDLPKVASALGMAQEEAAKKFGLEDVEDMEKEYDEIVDSASKFEKQQKKSNKQVKTGKELMDEFIDKHDINTLDALQDLSKLMGEIDDYDDLNRKFTVDSFDVDALDDKLSSLKENIASVEDAFDQMDEAMTNSNSARGMTTDDVDAIASLFGDLEGFDYDKLFESTSSGNHLNGKYFQQLQKQFADLEIDKYSNQVEKWQEEYQALCQTIATTNDVEEKRQAINKRDILSDKINKAKEYQSQIEGITNAVNLWQQAEARGDEGDLYDTVVGGLEDAKDMFKEGLIGDDEFQAFTQMFSNQDLSKLGSDEIAEVFQSKLPQMNSWLQEGNAGVNNFIKDVAKLNDGLIDAQGNVNFDAMPDVETLASQLGVSESLIDTMFKKLNQYGADLDFSEAADNLRSLRQEAIESGNALDEQTREKYSLNLDAEGEDSIKDQIDAAENLKEEMEKAGEDSGDAWEYLNDQLDYLEAKLGDIEGPEIDVETPEGLEAIEDAIDEINKKANVEIDIDWTSEDPSYYEGQIEELEGAIKKLDANGDGTIDIETEGGQEALDLLITLERKAYETGDTNISMSVDTSQLDGNVATMVSEFAEIQSAATTLNSYLHAQELGINVSDGQVDQARDNLASLIGDFQTAHTDTAEALSIDADVGDTSALDTMAQKVTELTGQEYAVKLKVPDEAIKGLDDSNKTITVDVNGGEKVQQLSNDIKEIPSNTTASVTVNVSGDDKVKTVKSAVDDINGSKSVSVTASVSGGDQVTNLKTNISTLPATKTSNVGANVSGQQDVDLLKRTINELRTRDVYENAYTSGLADVQTLKSTIDGLRSRDIYITTHHQTVGSPSGGDNVNGNAHAQGNANSLFARGRALAHGVWGAARDTTSLVGELGR